MLRNPISIHSYFLSDSKESDCIVGVGCFEDKNIIEDWKRIMASEKNVCLNGISSHSLMDMCYSKNVTNVNLYMHFIKYYSHSYFECIKNSSAYNAIYLSNKFKYIMTNNTIIKDMLDIDDSIKNMLDSELSFFILGMISRKNIYILIDMINNDILNFGDKLEIYICLFIELNQFSILEAVLLKNKVGDNVIKRIETMLLVGCDFENIIYDDQRTLYRQCILEEYYYSLRNKNYNFNENKELIRRKDCLVYNNEFIWDTYVGYFENKIQVNMLLIKMLDDDEKSLIYYVNMVTYIVHTSTNYKKALLVFHSCGKFKDMLIKSILKFLFRDHISIKLIRLKIVDYDFLKNEDFFVKAKNRFNYMVYLYESRLMNGSVIIDSVDKLINHIIASDDECLNLKWNITDHVLIKYAGIANQHKSLKVDSFARYLVNILKDKSEANSDNAAIKSIAYQKIYYFYINNMISHIDAIVLCNNISVAKDTMYKWKIYNLINNTLGANSLHCDYNFLTLYSYNKIKQSILQIKTTVVQYMLRKRAIDSVRMQTISMCNLNNNDDSKKIKNGCIYCIRAETMNVVKIGYWSFSSNEKSKKIVKLKQRYATMYGNDMDIKIVACNNIADKEKRIFNKMKNYKISNELYSTNHYDEYINMMKTFGRIEIV